MAAAGVAVALAVVLVVDFGDLGGDGATEKVSAPHIMTEREADEGGLEATGAAAPEPNGTPAASGAAAENADQGVAEDADGEFNRDGAAAETPAAEPEEVGAPAAAPSDGGIDALTAAEIGLAAALGILIVGRLALAFAGRKR